ncbi:hypothetical protein H4J46_05285 [Colwellia sp. MB02u-6]|uniref:RHS repeat-associated core domain-containing protein n=1 Tax=Colwellia sp. MB02u-6 TaxID=2759824 RepID=UPI0015F549FE|nr:RHS repeat-associated core domain-containing protein [Colwellia sp. MB02u-6]MBA6327357.1 hypothetical protein [Colwellia sp. MB02u-6]
MQARYYDPVIGRFYSNDPIGFTRVVDTFSRYSYLGNNGLMHFFFVLMKRVWLLF